MRTRIWEFFGELKIYKQSPCKNKKVEIEKRFDEILTTHTCYATLNQVLNQIHMKKSEILLVLDRPEIPLHNNTSETGILEYVKKRQINGSTRSYPGAVPGTPSQDSKRRAQAWGWILGLPYDRLTGKNSILSLANLMRLRVEESIRKLPPETHSMLAKVLPLQLCA